MVLVSLVTAFCKKNQQSYSKLNLWVQRRVQDKMRESMKKMQQNIILLSVII